MKPMNGIALQPPKPGSWASQRITTSGIELHCCHTSTLCSQRVYLGGRGYWAG